nr:MAG TPA: hypothetical protein [Caudoviricetes sp.]
MQKDERNSVRGCKPSVSSPRNTSRQGCRLGKKDESRNGVPEAIDTQESIAGSNPAALPKINQEIRSGAVKPALT